MDQSFFEDLLRQIEGLKGEVKELRADLRGSDARVLKMFEYVGEVTNQIVSQNRMPVVIQLSGFFIVIIIVVTSFFDWHVSGDYLGIKFRKGIESTTP